MDQEVSAKDKPCEHLGEAQGTGRVFPGELGWGCTAGGGDLGESSTTGLGEEVFTWHRRKQTISESAKNEEAGMSLSTLWGPALFTGFDCGKKLFFFFFLMRVVVILSMQSNAHYLIGTLPTGTSNIVLPLWFISEQGVLVIQSAAGTP